MDSGTSKDIFSQYFASMPVPGTGIPTATQAYQQAYTPEPWMNKADVEVLILAALSKFKRELLDVIQIENDKLIIPLDVLKKELLK